MKINLILGAMLLATITGSGMYIRSLLSENAILQANQVVLEDKITEQNESIKTYLANQERHNQQLTEIETQKNDAQRLVSELRNKFARHDLNNFALIKPKLIERRINSASKKVFEKLIETTNPNQFNENPDSDS
jgi:oligoendopeptidase F